jgi:hypothetical protein
MPVFSQSSTRVWVRQREGSVATCQFMQAAVFCQLFWISPDGYYAYNVYIAELRG